MNHKELSILFNTLDRETRHYIMRRIEHPYKKFPGPKQKNSEK